MSRRYGRNQKRKHRAEISRLTSELAHSEALRSPLYRRYIDLQENLADIMRVIKSVTEHSVALPPENIPFNGRLPRERRMAKRVPFDSLMLLGPKDAIRSADYVDVYALEYYLRENREKFQASIHFNFCNGGEAAYMISMEGFMHVPEEVIMQRFGPEIARDLIRYLRGGK
jgi:hypothetical protein